MAKPIKIIIKLQIPAGQATPAPPVGTALGPHGLNIQDFVSKFNEGTRDPASDLLRKAAGVDKGSGVPNKNKVGKVSKAQIRKIAKDKMPDLNTNNVDAASKIIEGTARSMGITVE